MEAEYLLRDLLRGGGVVVRERDLLRLQGVGERKPSLEPSSTLSSLTRLAGHRALAAGIGKRLMNTRDVGRRH